MKIIILGFLLISTNLLSQSMTSSSPNVDLYDLSVKVQSLGKSNKAADVEGSIYLFDEYKRGNLTFTVYNSIEDVDVRLDLMNTNIEVIKDSKVFIVGNVVTLSEIELEGKTYVIRSYEEDDEQKTAFFNLEKVKDVEILTLHKVEFKAGRKSTSSYSDDIPDRFVKEDEDLYLKFGDSDLIKVNSNRQFKVDLKKMDMPDLYNYYINNRIKIKDYSDREALIAFFNESV